MSDTDFRRSGFYSLINEREQPADLAARVECLKLAAELYPDLRDAALMKEASLLIHFVFTGEPGLRQEAPDA